MVVSTARKPTGVVVVTGGSQGIGFSIVEAFLSSGWRVVVGSRSAGQLSTLNSSNLIYRQTDVRDEDSVKELFTVAIENFSGVDVLINNAGYSEWRSIEKIDQKFLNNIFSTNVMSVFWTCKAASLIMRPGASIINISSIAGKRGSSNNSAYVATKFAMNGITQSLAKELGPRGIRVNSVCPVLIPTPGLIDALSQSDSPASSDPMDFINSFAASQSALGSLPSGEDVASMCLFLAGKGAVSITGQNINVDCGVFPQ